MVAPALGAEWMTDFEAAKARAAAENKAILVNFTGSDWCGYCMRMKRNVLDKQEFLDYTRDKFAANRCRRRKWKNAATSAASMR